MVGTVCFNLFHCGQKAIPVSRNNGNVRTGLGSPDGHTLSNPARTARNLNHNETRTTYIVHDIVTPHHNVTTQQIVILGFGLFQKYGQTDRQSNDGHYYCKHFVFDSDGGVNVRASTDRRFNEKSIIIQISTPDFVGHRNT